IGLLMTEKLSVVASARHCPSIAAFNTNSYDFFANHHFYSGRNSSYYFFANRSIVICHVNLLSPYYNGTLPCFLAGRVSRLLAS
ncbi:hypothetical protein, partial [Olsenella uli]|uniref:hypothetical protein n=1 Tax=Olsenella uli TaxID=133926 RepID=UPI0019592EE7